MVKTYIWIIGLIIILSAYLDLGNYWEYMYMVKNAILWQAVYIILAVHYIGTIGKNNWRKWYNFLTTSMISIIIASGFLDIIYQCQATKIRIVEGEKYHGVGRWLYYSISAKKIEVMQPLYHGLYYPTLALFGIVIFLFITCSGYLHGKVGSDGNND